MFNVSTLLLDDALLKCWWPLVCSSNAGGVTALHCAAEAGNVPCLKALIATGVQIDVADSHQRTAHDLCKIHARQHCARYAPAVSPDHPTSTFLDGPNMRHFRHKTIRKWGISNEWQWRLRKLNGYELLMPEKNSIGCRCNASQNPRQSIIAAYICLLTNFTELQLMDIQASYCVGQRHCGTPKQNFWWAMGHPAHPAAPPTFPWVIPLQQIFSVAKRRYRNAKTSQ